MRPIFSIYMCDRMLSATRGKLACEKVPPPTSVYYAAKSSLIESLQQNHQTNLTQRKHIKGAWQTTY